MFLVIPLKGQWSPTISENVLVNDKIYDVALKMLNIVLKILKYWMWNTPSKLSVSWGKIKKLWGMIIVIQATLNSIIQQRSFIHCFQQKSSFWMELNNIKRKNWNYKQVFWCLPHPIAKQTSTEQKLTSNFAQINKERMWIFLKWVVLQY